MPKSYLDQKPWHKAHFFHFLFFAILQRKNTENLLLINGHLGTISGHFLANYINIFHKIELQTIIMMCLTCLNLFWIKSYNIKYNFCHFLFLQFCKKKYWKFMTQNGHFRNISGHELATTWDSSTKKRFRQSFWDV